MCPWPSRPASSPTGAGRPGSPLIKKGPLMADERSAREPLTPCSGRNKDGSACRARAQRGSPFCLAHDPRRVTDLAAWRKQGGKASSNASRARKQLAGDVQDMAGVKARLMVALAQVESGQMDPGPANAMANLARAIATISGVADFELHLADLRHQIAVLTDQRGA